MGSKKSATVSYTPATAEDLTSDIGKGLQAYTKTMPGILAFEQQYRPQYTALNLGEIGQYGTGYSQLGGQLGMEGVQQTQQARMGELMGQGQLAYGARGVMQTLSPEQAGLVSQATQRANQAYAGSQYLTPQESRMALQSARESSASRGMLGSQGGIAAEVLQREAYKQAKRSEADTARTSAFNLANQFYSAPGMSLISQTPVGLNLGQSYLSSAQQSLGASTPQLFSSDTFLNIGAAERGNVLSAKTATAANRSAIKGATIGAIGNIIGSVAGGYATGAGLKSDIRVKNSIKRVGATDSGLPVYTFKYNGSDVTHMGVMAQDVEKVNPDAVIEIDGVKRVYYDKI